MKAIKMLEVGLMAIKTGMHKHMEAMKALAHAPPQAGGSATGRMQQLVAKLQAKVQAEIADPARAHDPMVGLDLMMLKALKTAVAKSEALEAAAKEVAAEHPEQAKAAAVALKQQLSKVAGDLKAEMADIKKKAMLMMIIMKEEAAKKEKKAPADAEAEAEAPAGEDAEAEAPAEAKAPAEEDAEAEAPAEAKAPAEEDADGE